MFEGGAGFIVPGVAVCWLFGLDGSVCILEHLTANPVVETSERSAGIDAVVSAAMAYAKSCGCRYVYAVTSLDSVLERSKRHGFRHVNSGMHLIAAGL